MVVDLFDDGDECQEMLDKCGPLSPDPSCDNFVKRSKNIVYVKFKGEKMITSDKNYFM